MPSIICLLALLLACSDGDDAASTASKPAAPQPQATAPVPSAADLAAAQAKKGPDLSVPTAATAPTGMAQLAAAGRTEAALAAARQAIQTAPSDPLGWRVYGQAGAATGQALALFAELESGRADGDKTAAYHLLRAELALASDKPDAAFEAAGLAAVDDGDGGAGAQALAVNAGARLPREIAVVHVEDATPAQALLHLAAARDFAKAMPWLDAAAKVGGWRADLARAQALSRLKQTEAAQAAFAQAAGSDDPRGVLAGNLGRAQLALAGGDTAKAMQWAGLGADAAAASGDIAGAAAALSLSLQAGQQGRDLDGPLTAAQSAADKATAASGGTLAPALALALGRAGLLAGRPDAVLRPLWTASMSAAAAKDSLSAELDAIAALAGLQAGIEVATTTIATGAAQDTAAAALAGIVTSRPDFAPALDHFDPVDAALVGMAATDAHIDASSRLKLLRAAATAADRSGLPLLRLEAWLRVDTAARRAGVLKVAAAARASASSAAVTASPALLAELGARAALAQDPGAVVPAQGSGTWAALLAQTAPPAGADDLSRGVAAWASARALAVQGKGAEAAKAYLDALGQLPTHRFGRLSLGTVLDGSQGLPIRPELDMEKKLDVEAAPVVVMAAHELLHRASDVARQVAAGRDLVSGLSPAAASAALGASARGRAEVARWLLGGDPAKLADVVQAETDLAEQPTFARLLPTSGEAAMAVARNDAGAALISIVQLGDRFSMAVLSGRGFAVGDVGPVDKVTGVFARHAAALRQHADAAATGIAVRHMVLDPFAQDLAGVARFIVIAPAALQSFGLAVVPEQDEALRWLDDIRDVSQASTITSLVRPEHLIRLYRPDLLVLGPPAAPDAAAAAQTAAPPKKPKEQPAGAERSDFLQAEDEPLPAEIGRGTYPGLSKLPADIAVAVHSFSRGSRQLAVGTDAILSTWESGVPTARVIQISDVEPAVAGGFQLADGVLSLDAIRATPMQADLVLITAVAEPEIQLQRAQAFLDAGARSVVISAWESAMPNLKRYLSTFYDARNQENPTIRAVEQARLAVRNDPLRHDTNRQPGVWGSWFLVGRP
jgi:hypothetical protein